MKHFLVSILSLLLLASFPVFAGKDVKGVHYDFVIAADGTGDFKSVQSAIMAIPDIRKATTRILLKKGTYKEKIVLPESKQNVIFAGEGEGVIITYDDFATRKNRFGEEIGTSGSAGLYIYGVNIRFENITFSNTAGPVGQAVAVRVAGDKIQFVNCRFLGFQDTLYTFGTQSRQYYLHCYIEGTIDFIFGSSTAVFDSCTIFGKQDGFFTAASTLQHTEFGYVFRHCNITGSGKAGSFKLGRPWRPYAKTVFIDCE
ncbi:MAG: pectin esterase, partial [Sphingobacteriales bacterium]